MVQLTADILSRFEVPMRTLLAVVWLICAPAAMAQDTFHGWSRDGSWLAYESHGQNDLVELYFCATDPQGRPTWPAALDELEREEGGKLSCVRFIDVNKAPYEWKAKLVAPKPAKSTGGLKVLAELVTDGETPGFVLEAADKKQVCEVLGLRGDSVLEHTWFHPSGRFVAARIDGIFHHCLVTLKAPKKTK